MTALPKLIDCKGLMDHTGLKRAGAEAIMRALPKVILDDHRKVYVRLADVERYIAEKTVAA